jgi:GNAT superfamily N-acetyltransferase
MSASIRISTDPADIDFDWLVPALSERAYWALGRPRELIERSVAGSRCFIVLDGQRQVGFARVITDRATFAWICDVFVDEGSRGQGIGRRLMQAIIDDPQLAGLKRMVLATNTPDFYRPLGFETLPNPERWMLRPGPIPTD